MALRVAVDFGTSSTCVAVSVHGREPQVVVVDGQPLLSSSVYAAPDGTLFVGQEADRQAALDPSRYEPHPKRRIDERELLLGDTVLPVVAVFRAVLGRAVNEARRVAGGVQVAQLVLTHPADWGGVRTQVLRQAAAGLAQRIVLVPEPVAAAVFHSASYPAPTGPQGRTLAVLDLGGGTVDVSVVRTSPPARPGLPPAYTVLATRGDPHFGGADIDELLLGYVGDLVSSGDPDSWRALVEGRDLADRRRRRVLRQDIRGAKETLSRHPYTDVPLPSPFPDAHVTRTDLERLIGVPVGRAVDLTLATIHEAGLAPQQLAGIFLVGGSSRIPLVARLVAERTGMVPVTLDQPETVVARGALRAAAVEPDHTGAMAARPGRSGPAGVLAAESTMPVDHRPPLPPRPMGPHSGPLPVPRPAKPRRTALLVGAAVVVVAAVAVTMVVLLGRETPPAEAGPVIAQYEYRFTRPDGWTQTGGNPGLLRTEIKPVGAEKGDDLVLVEEKRLVFDSDADRARAVDKLRSDYESGGDEFTDFSEKVTFGGREVVSYRERLDRKDATVDWYVLFQGKSQVSVGCQYTESGRDKVRQACESVVRTMAIEG
ncbi:type VII secretion-associated protein [Actinokineospora xionganensis]|uniref:Type VII secretion-associated protein n=1 Tax=Actinokineospora xionganensis TaxID=2684470 RepID=A0ABR7L0W0_9PSEU|nr:type VII secretion-associated protein [Actinokineospora xionganensis]MBC6446324.1 type VII secretion-associated protein [Actinokineospora xionganensis]